jgi:hypothetical protein
MPAKLLNFGNGREPSAYVLTFGFFEDFLEFTSGDMFTDTSADTGASWAVQDAVGGTVLGATGATDNNEAYLHTTKELFKIANGKPMICGCRLKYTEANTDDANVAFGLMDAVGANSLVDDGAGPKTSYSGAVFYKVDGGTKWKVQVSDSTTQTSKTTDKTAGGSSYHTLEIELNPRSSTSCEASFWIDTAGGINLIKAREDGANPRTPDIKLDFDYANATEMMVFVGVKAGGANSEAPTVDAIWAYQKR